MTVALLAASVFIAGSGTLLATSTPKRPRWWAETIKPTGHVLIGLAMIMAIAIAGSGGIG